MLLNVTISEFTPASIVPIDATLEPTTPVILDVPKILIVPVLAKAVEITWFILVNGVTFVSLVVVPVISTLSDNVNIPLFLRLITPA